MVHLSAAWLHPRGLFNGTPPGLSGVGLNGDNPSTGSIIGTSPRDESFNPPTTDLQSSTSSLTPTSTSTRNSLTASSATTTTTSTTTTTTSAQTTSSNSSSSNRQIGNNSSIGPGDALFATSVASTTASATAPQNPHLTGTGNSSTGPITLSSTTTNTKVVPLPLTATVSDWLTTSSPIASSNPTGSPKHASLAPGIIIGAVLAGIVAVLCLLAAVICYRRLRGRRESRSEGRPRLPALNTGVHPVTPYDYQPFSRPSQGGVTMTGGNQVFKRTTNPYSAARDTLQRVVHRSHISPLRRTAEPGSTSRRGSRVPLLDGPDQAVAPSYSPQENLASPVSMYTASPILTGHFVSFQSPNLPYAPSEKQTDSVVPSGNSILHSGHEGGGSLPVGYIADDASEVVSEPPPAYES